MKTLTELMELADDLTEICVDSASAESAEELTEYIKRIREAKTALQTALAEVFAERDALKSQLDDYTLMMTDKEINAARYQWLKSIAVSGDDSPCIRMQESGKLLIGDEADSAMDAAMKGTS